MCLLGLLATALEASSGDALYMLSDLTTQDVVPGPAALATHTWELLHMQIFWPHPGLLNHRQRLTRSLWDSCIGYISRSPAQ